MLLNVVVCAVLCCVVPCVIDYSPVIVVVVVIDILSKRVSIISRLNTHSRIERFVSINFCRRLLFLLSFDFFFYVKNAISTKHQINIVFVLMCYYCVSLLLIYFDTLRFEQNTNSFVHLLLTVLSPKNVELIIIGETYLRTIRNL